MKKLMGIIVLLSVCETLVAATEVINGLEWTYSGSSLFKGWYSSVIPNTTKGKVSVPSTLGGNKITSIGNCAFEDCSSLTEIVIPEGVVSIDECAFRRLSAKTTVYIPESATGLSPSAFGYNDYECTVGAVVCRIKLPTSWSAVGGSRNALKLDAPLFVQRKYAGDWYVYCQKTGIPFGGIVDSNIRDVVVLSSSIRENDPTIMDVTYRVVSLNDVAKVRVLAFESGNRSFSNVIRPQTFLNGSERYIGDEITANVDHNIEWKISSDWKIDLAKVTFEVIASDDSCLDLNILTIPGTSSRRAFQISWNAITESQAFNALMWLYAVGADDLLLSNGVLKTIKGKTLATGTSVNGAEAVSYIFSKMGYSVLGGADLEYARSITRLNLVPNGVRQYAMKELE